MIYRVSVHLIEATDTESTQGQCCAVLIPTVTTKRFNLHTTAERVETLSVLGVHRGLTVAVHVCDAYLGEQEQFQ